MKKNISATLLGGLALLCSSAGFAASVSVLPSATSVNNGATFYEVLHGDFGAQQTTGSTLQWTYSNAVITNSDLCTVANCTIVAPPHTGTASAFNTLQTGAPPQPPGPQANLVSPQLVSVLQTGPLVSGSFDAYVLTFTAQASAACVAAYNAITNPTPAACNANVQLVDQGSSGDFNWSASDSSGIDGITTTQSGAVYVVPVPVPAAAWLFGSGLGLLGFVRRRMTV